MPQTLPLEQSSSDDEAGIDRAGQDAAASEARRNADKEKRLVALGSVLAAVFLTTMKIVIGLMTGSLGILSEAAHSGLDLVAAAVTLFAVRVSGRPADREHLYGHGKIENLSALFETMLLLVTCVWIIYEALQRLFFKPVAVEASLWAFVIMAVSIAIDFTRSRALDRAAKKYHSQALEADALHFSTDIWSSSVVIAGLFLVRLAGWLNITWLSKADALAAMGVAGIVVYVSLQLGQRTVTALLDGTSPEMREQVVRAVRLVPGVAEVRQVRIRHSGPEAFADMALAISRDATLEHAHTIATMAEAAVRQVLPGADVTVHIDPVRSDNESTLETVRLLAAQHGLGAHNIHVYNVRGNPSLELHLEVDKSLQVAEAHRQATAFEGALRQALPGILRIVTHIEPVGDAVEVRRAARADETQVRQALQAMLAELGIPCRPHEVKVYRAGSELAVSFHCALDGSATIDEAHSLTQKLEQDLRARVPGLGRVVIHVEPRDAG